MHLQYPRCPHDDVMLRVCPEESGGSLIVSANEVPISEILSKQETRKLGCDRKV